MLLDMSEREYVANGSRFQAAISCLHENCDEPTVQVIDIGKVYVPLRSVISITINLQDEKHTEILRNLRLDTESLPRSTIITEEGCIEYGYCSDWDVRDWMWKSSTDGTDHRPKTFFVANASGGSVHAFVSDDGKHFTSYFVNINPGKAETLESAYVKIKIPNLMPVIIYEGPAKPRKSIIVCPEVKPKITGTLYGKDIEAQKWIVDGMSYNPKTVMEENREKLQVD